MATEAEREIGGRALRGSWNPGSLRVPWEKLAERIRERYRREAEAVIDEVDRYRASHPTGD